VVIDNRGILKRAVDFSPLVVWIGQGEISSINNQKSAWAILDRPWRTS
jgi:hypothetical protein